MYSQEEKLHKQEYYKENRWQRIAYQKDYHLRIHPRYLEYQRGIKLRYLEEGRCYQCSSPLIEDEGKYCMFCLSNEMRV